MSVGLAFKCNSQIVSQMREDVVATLVPHFTDLVIEKKIPPAYLWPKYERFSALVYVERLSAGVRPSTATCL